MSIFRHSREFAATPETVFEAFSNPALLACWWGPDGFSNTFDIFEFHPGGRWLFTMHGPDGVNYPNQSEFLEITSPSFIRLRHVNLPHFELSVTLEPSAMGTLLSWVFVFQNEKFAEPLRQFLETANEQNLNRLAQVIGMASETGD